MTPGSQEFSKQTGKEKDRIDVVLSDSRISNFLENNVGGRERTRNAAEWLCREYPGSSNEQIILTLSRLLTPLRDEKMTVFFSYKAKDKAIATQIADWFKEWSAGKLVMEHMARFGLEHVGRDWREKIETTIPQCDWFLLLMPSPGEERDWPLYEAGYFERGQPPLAGRMVCLHHPDNEIADALGPKQSVPGVEGDVVNFLTALFKEGNWIPGFPALNDALSGLEEKAQEIVKLIRPPVSPSIKECCAPHMALRFNNTQEISRWEELAKVKVVDVNTACLNLFNLYEPRQTFGEWFTNCEDAGRDEPWVEKFIEAIQKAYRAEVIPPIEETLSLPSRRVVKLAICATRRSRPSRSLEGVDLLFSEVNQQRDTLRMDPKLTDLAITLHLAVLFRWKLLVPFARRELNKNDAIAFNSSYMQLAQEALRDFQVTDPEKLRKNVESLFEGEERDKIENMYNLWDELRNRKGEGELDKALCDMDTVRIKAIVDNLLEVNRQFLDLASKRSVKLIAGS